MSISRKNVLLPYAIIAGLLSSMLDFRALASRADEVPTVKIQDVARFPDDYIGKTIQFKSVVSTDVSDMSRLSADEQKILGAGLWGLEVFDPDAIGWPIFRKDAFGAITAQSKACCILNEQQARSLAKHLNSERKKYAVLTVHVLKARHPGYSDREFYILVLKDLEYVGGKLSADFRR